MPTYKPRTPHPSRWGAYTALVCICVSLGSTGGDAAQAQATEGQVEQCTRRFDYPEPGGAYEVGTVAHEFDAQDDAGKLRDEPWKPGNPRRLALQIWYPALSQEGMERAPYFSAMEKEAYLPTELFIGASLDLCEADLLTYSYPGADARPGTFPVLLFHHGGGGYLKQNTIQAEHLASHGYIVVSVGHPYGRICLLYTSPSPRD